MEKLQMNAFQIIGISVKTSNEEGKAKTDIGGLWATFMSKNMLEK